MAAAEWARLSALATSMKVLTVADGPVLEAVCLAYEELRAAQDVLAAEGRFYRTVSVNGTMHRVHPAVAVAADAWRRYVAGLAQFGLSPAARAKVATVPDQERDDLTLWQGGKGA